jgi:hypothetical protein
VPFHCDESILSYDREPALLEHSNRPDVVLGSTRIQRANFYLCQELLKRTSGKPIAPVLPSDPVTDLRLIIPTPQRIEARRRSLESGQARRDDTRRKILVGAIVLTKFEARWRATPARVAPENSSVAKLAGFAVNTQPEEIDI